MTRRYLPDHLDSLKQEAKSLLKAVKAGDNEALHRVAPYFDDSANVSLQNIQLVIAREYQFASWSKLKAYVSMPINEKANREHAAENTPVRVVDPRFRGTTEYLRQLFDERTPELERGQIRILSAARVPGVRAKIAVTALDSSVNPVGACVGLDGERVQAISKALDGERIDILLWSENLDQFIENGLAPARVERVVVDAVRGKATVHVARDQYDTALGKNGDNVRLASELCRCQITVRTAA